jgi:hypothetical protein
MLLSIPTKAQETFIQLCHDTHEAETLAEFKRLGDIAKTYSRAIRDICGQDVWAEIAMEADRSFHEDVPVCAGIPIFFPEKNK